GALQFASVQQEARLKEDLTLIARAVRLPIGRNLEQGDIDGVQSALRSVFAIGRVHGASVYDVDGQRVAAAGIATREPISDAAATTAVSTGQIQERYEEVHGRNVFLQFQPVLDSGGRINGLLQISRRQSDFHAALHELERTAWAAWVVLALMMTAIVVIGHYRGVGRHVNHILAAMRRIERGEPALPVDQGGPRELTAIGAGFNRMLAGMAQAQAQLETHRQSEATLNEKLRHQEKMAAIGRIASGVAHELGAPMSVILGRARRIEQSHPDDPVIARQITAIRQQSERLTALVEQLLEYCRPSSAARRPVAPLQLLETSVHALRPEMAAAGPAIEVDAASALPSFEGDPRRLELALVNLLRNAVQAARTVVRVSAAAHDGVVTIAVDDDGPGLSIAASQALEPFFTTKAAGEGTGLGLAIVNHIVAEHGGRLEISRSRLGGCRVSLLLPVGAECGERE
ncbi:MAG: ATP-binding protein, partial [Gammaproteobacteria bacterium]